MVSGRGRNDSNVLIEGETGTGKGTSSRKPFTTPSQRVGRAFHKLNCAAIPLDLLESELFGHEKGAFTEPSLRKIGRFEWPINGTLFLDEWATSPRRCSEIAACIAKSGNSSV